MNLPKPPCPLCRKVIDPMNLPSVCPACGHTEQNSNIFVNCEFCRFARHYIKCPHCKKEFDLMLLLGEYKDENGNVIPPEARKEYKDRYSFVVGQLNLQFYRTVEKNILTKFGEQALRHIAETTFTFPFNIASAVVHTVHISSDGSRWFHIWLYQTKEQALSEKQPFGQITVVYPGFGEGGSRDNSKGSCVVKEVFYAPQPSEEERTAGTYSIIDFLKISSIVISPDIQNREVAPFTMQSAKHFFANFERESFAFDGVIKAILIYEGKENLPNHSYAEGFLFSQSCEELQTLRTMPQSVGAIHFEYGGKTIVPCIKVTKL